MNPCPEKRALLPCVPTARKVAKSPYYLPFQRVLSQEGIGIDVDLQSD
jgi:hypothetical protein